MRSRFVTVRDSLTKMRCLVLELEEVDRAVCDGSRILPGLRIVLRFEGRQVTCISGYELRDAKGGTVAQLTKAMGTDGTITAFKEMLHYLEDIRHLPSEIESRRGASNMPHLSLAISSVRRSKKQYLSCLVSL
jgi:hypothetical protein